MKDQNKWISKVLATAIIAFDENFHSLSYIISDFHAFHFYFINVHFHEYKVRNLTTRLTKPFVHIDE